MENPNTDHEENKWQCEACSKWFLLNDLPHHDSEDNEFCSECFINLLDCEVGDLRERLADAYIRLSGKKSHSSTCATSCAPARTPEECDCDVQNEGNAPPAQESKQ